MILYLSSASTFAHSIQIILQPPPLVAPQRIVLVTIAIHTEALPNLLQIRHGEPNHPIPLAERLHNLLNLPDHPSDCLAALCIVLDTGVFRTYLDVLSLPAQPKRRQFDRCIATSAEYPEKYVSEADGLVWKIVEAIREADQPTALDLPVLLLVEVTGPSAPVGSGGNGRNGSVRDQIKFR